MSRFINPVPQFWLDNGDIASSGLMCFYENGDYSTPKKTFADRALTVENTNPVKLDGQGRMPPCEGQGLYSVKFYAYDNAAIDKKGSLQWTRDDVDLSGGAAGAFSEWSSVQTYAIGTIVKDNGYYYNLYGSTTSKGERPSTTPEKWEKIVFITEFNENKAYANQENVVHLGYLYRSNTNDNTSTPPSADWDNLTFNDSLAGDLSVGGNLTVVGSISGGSISKTTDNGINFVAVKKLSTARSSTISASQDPDLIVNGLINGADYHVSVLVSWTGNGSTANGLRATLGYTSGITRVIGFSNTVGTAGATIESSSGGPAIFYPTVASVYNQVMKIDAVVRVDAGNSIYLSWAQGASGATATTINSGSMTVTKLP